MSQYWWHYHRCYHSKLRQCKYGLIKFYVTNMASDLLHNLKHPHRNNNEQLSFWLQTL